MKIAMIGQKGLPATYGGIEKHVEILSEGLAEKGHLVTVFSRPHYSDLDGRFGDVRVEKTFSVNTKHLDAISHTFVCSVKSLFRNFDIVHYHALGPSILSFIPRFSGKKIFSTIHGLDWQRGKWGRFAKACLRTAERATCIFPHAVITVSKTLKDYYMETYGKKVTYIPNGVILPELTPPGKTLDKFSLEPENYILFLSRLVPEKGCLNLINAFRKVKTEMKLAMVGGSSASEDYVAKIKEAAKGDDRIVFTDYQYGENLSELFSNPYFYVLPSHLEGLPIALLEALSFRNAVLASDIPPNMEIVDPYNGGERFGFSFKTADENDLQEKMERLLANPDSVKNMKGKSVSLLRNDFNWDKVIDETEDLYRTETGLT